MVFTIFLDFLGDKKLGFFGCGHLGKAILTKLLEQGFPKNKIIVSHKGNPETKKFLESKGVNIVPSSKLLNQAKCIFYLVRPQEIDEKQDKINQDCLVVSFLAGVTLNKLKIIFGCDVMRVLPYSANLILMGDTMSAVYHSFEIFDEVIESLELRQVCLKDEEEMHYFTGLAACLPNVLTYLDGKFDEKELLSLQDLVSFDYLEIIKWAKKSYQKNLSVNEKKSFFRKSSYKRWSQ
jgi:pyrroline-5-carboxylate reductase